MIAVMGLILAYLIVGIVAFKMLLSLLSLSKFKTNEDMASFLESGVGPSFMILVWPLWVVCFGLLALLLILGYVVFRMTRE